MLFKHLDFFKWNEIAVIYVFANIYFLWRKQGMTQYNLDFTIINPVPVHYHITLENRYALYRSRCGVTFLLVSDTFVK